MSDSRAPLVSIIVSARNEARRIAECLASLLRQTYAATEIIVVDDGSSDGTAAIAAEYAGVRVLRRPHSGHGASMSAGAAVANGAILCFLDADMVFEPGFVAALVAPIVAGETIGTSHATEIVANPDNRWGACWQRRAGLPLDRRLVLSARQLEEGTTTFRAILADEYRRVGGHDHIGYMDDQTLSPKLGRRARWVPEARCRHYNVETLGEVVALGAWGARTIWHRYGRKALLSYAPPLIAWHAVREGLRFRSADMAAYTIVFEWGVLRGLWSRLRGA